jgi:hypothetical protein
MHIHCKWRSIVFDSQQPLQLRLLCTHGMPVLKTLECWPTMPIIVQYGGSPALEPPAPEDKGSIVAALKQSDCITSISLTVTPSLLETLSTINRPFLELEDLVLLSRNNMRLTLPGSFQWGPHLQRLHLTGVTFPALVLQLRYHSKNIVDLHLHEVLKPSRFQLDTLLDALSGMAHLQSLSLHFLPTTKPLTSPPPYRKLIILPLILPALICLTFQRRTEHLEGLVTRIDAPLLGQIKVTFLNESDFDLSKLRVFIDRIGMHKSHCRAEIVTSNLANSISLTQPGDATCLKFKFQ